jgi:hypothetical protein
MMDMGNIVEFVVRGVRGDFAPDSALYESSLSVGGGTT